MAAKFSEEQVHEHLFRQGLECVIDDAPEFDVERVAESVAGTESAPLDESEAAHDEAKFELWRIIKAKTLEKLVGLHRTIRYGEFIGSKVKLPIDSTRPMELDLLGQHEACPLRWAKNLSAVFIAVSFSAAASTINWFMVVPSAAASSSIAAFRDAGSFTETVISLVVTLVPP